MAKLEVRNLRISFRTNNGAVRAVRDISFDLNEGETLAIVGESGSGKSVTARAVMGILAGNAMVENGSITYDGRDLLKIPEEEFHTLRGHKLAMVFQDPLSALNPIMRIGQQLTEAMLVNNRERRKDGRKKFNETLKLLEKRIIDAQTLEGASQETKQKTSENIKKFDNFVKTSVEMESRYSLSKEAAIEAMDAIEELRIEMISKPKSVDELVGHLLHSLKVVFNEYLIPEGDPDFTNAIASLEPFARRYVADDSAKLTSALDRVSTLLKCATEKAEPNFFCIGYAMNQEISARPGNDDIPALNAWAREVLDKSFMTSFLNDVRKALQYSHIRSVKEKKEAVEALKKALAVFTKDKLDKGECSRAVKTSADEVEDVIDRLELKKDNLSYIYRSTMNAGLKRYFYGLSFNPKEKARFERDTERYNRQVKNGKIADAVVPMNLVDVEAARENMVKTIRDLINLYEKQIADDTPIDFEALAVEMIDFLKARASEYAYKLSNGMAKHRAIELMKEVGIPEPHKRFHQYPGEFSGGMRQRIVIAIALSANPDILICDEPTTALDVTIQAQILELIGQLKKQRRLSVIFITHDLGMVANIADRVAVMYAGKIVEYGTADDVFYSPAHPYTWALLSSMPDIDTKEKLEAIPGTPPDMILPPKGDAFAARNKYAMQIDFEEQPPFFRISDTHEAATWLLHPNAPKVEPPLIVTERIARMKKLKDRYANQQNGGANA